MFFLSELRIACFYAAFPCTCFVASLISANCFGAWLKQTAKRKVLLIGWDAADWEVITPMLEEGLMPALDGLINRGVMGNLATLQPILSPCSGTQSRPESLPTSMASTGSLSRTRRTAARDPTRARRGNARRSGTCSRNQICAATLSAGGRATPLSRSTALLSQTHFRSQVRSGTWMDGTSGDSASGRQSGTAWPGLRFFRPN